jgi:hypothetical protein
LAYADDIDLMTHTIPGLNEAFLNLQKSARNMGLIINQEKTVNVGVSKSFETSSKDSQPMAVRECVRCAWEQGTSPLSMPSGVAV